MEAYHWSWRELQETPEYVRRVCFWTQMMKNAKQQGDIDSASRRQPDAGMATWGP